ncbi:MAG: helix-turn-helix domain-containing protein [Brachybacterium sp.]|uniref:TetR/AcrR family transcriptional regulator n=1 Tax=Brachybacterium sp. TaxID=1891286 RepID=UPI003242A1A6
MSTTEPRPGRRRPGRPRGQDSSVVREAALRAAIDLIAEHGYAATSMAQVAEAAGISPSGLAHHFPSKAALLGAVLDHRDATDNVPVSEDAGTWAVFDGLVELARINAGRRQLVALYTTVIGEAVGPDHPAHDWMLRHFEVSLALLEDAVREGQRAGEIAADAPARHIARTTISLMDGLQVQWLLDPSVDMPAELHLHVAELKRRWGTDPAPS